MAKEKKKPAMNKKKVAKAPAKKPRAKQPTANSQQLPAKKKASKKLQAKSSQLKASKLEAKSSKLASCVDRNCPIHSSIKTRGRVFEGKVIKAKMAKTITIEWPRRFYLSKYERFEKRRSRVKAHNSACIGAKQGDRVRIAECRPISKSKAFVVVEVLK